jgi:hypothetical protein
MYEGPTTALSLVGYATWRSGFFIFGMLTKRMLLRKTADTPNMLVEYLAPQLYVSEVLGSGILKQDRRCTYNGTLRCVRAIIVAEEKPSMLHILGMGL